MDLSEPMEHENGTSQNEKHVQITFFSKDDEVAQIPDAVFDVPTGAECDDLNLLLNKTIEATNEKWKDRRFELLVGESFLRTSLAEFIEEYEVETETILKVERVLGIEAPKPLHDIQAPDWVSSVQIAHGHIEKGILVEKMILRGHERAVECVSVNTDSTRAISGSVDTNLKVWNLEASDEATIYEKEGEENAKKRRKEETKMKVPMVTIGGHRDKVSAIEWCPWKAGHAFSSSYDHTIVEWDLELAGEVSRIKGPKSFTDISIHPTSGLIISSCTDAVPRLYDPKNRDRTIVKQSFIGHQNGWVESVKWNPLDANQFVSVSTDRTGKMWDIRSSKSSLFDIHGHEDRILCAAWNERLIATGSADCTIKSF
uniref:WD_REPEATS_REGION domain-containing protein n=1 Tax=Caenorhabditis tropicalis TaxID=1561998 RepID=A0A1I7U5U2_9PELO